MGQPYVSNKFRTGAEFEAWIEAKNAADATLQGNIEKIVNGTTEVSKATNSTNAVNANHATSADRAASATNATNAQNAGHATSADSATNAGHANTATKATQDSNGDNIVDTYAKKNGTYDGMTVGNATKATQDAEGKNIKETYATKVSLNQVSETAYKGLGAEYIHTSPAAIVTIPSATEARVYTVFAMIDEGVGFTSTVYVPPISYIKTNGIKTIVSTGNASHRTGTDGWSLTPIVYVVYNEEFGSLSLQFQSTTSGTAKIYAVYWNAVSSDYLVNKA